MRGRARRSACAPAATGRSTRCGWRRATASGAPTSPPETTPDEAGLGLRGADGQADFLGRDALLAARERRRAGRRLRCLVLDDPRAVCLGTEPVRVDGEPCGRVTSGGYGYRVGAASPTPTCPPTVESGAAGRGGRLRPLGGRRGRAREPLYDPENVRVRA